MSNLAFLRHPSTAELQELRMLHATPTMRWERRIALKKHRILIATHVSSPSSRRRCVVGALGHAVVLLLQALAAAESEGAYAYQNVSLPAKPPSAGRIDVWDEDYPGFGLRISASGRRTWILMYRMGKTLRRFTLGQYPTLGLAEARSRARDALHEVDHGQDPARDKIAERQAETFARSRARVHRASREQEAQRT